MTIDIGKRLRASRIAHGKVIDDIAGATGLSRAYISQVETGKASPSIQTLEKMSAALDISVSSLFVEDGGQCTVIRAADRRHVHFGEPDVSYRKTMQYLSPPDRLLELAIVEIPPRSTAIDKAHSHEGEEACHVLEGEVEVIYGDETHTLCAGDSVHWDSRTPHWLKNVSDRPAKLIVARTPSGLMDMRFDPAAAEETA
ncbi:MAG: cupin domain-containing protein [Alphaproteobacteria bacterium]